MNFRIGNMGKKDFATKCVYDELSIYTLGNNADGSLAINNTYLTIDFDIFSKRVFGISGFIGEINDLPKKEAEEINVLSDAELFVETNSDFLPGIGYSFCFDGNMSYDPKKKYFKIISETSGSIENKWYRIANNIFVALGNNKLLGIVVKL